MARPVPIAKTRLARAFVQSLNRIKSDKLRDFPVVVDLKNFVKLRLESFYSFHILTFCVVLIYAPPTTAARGWSLYFNNINEGESVILFNNDLNRID